MPFLESLLPRAAAGAGDDAAQAVHRAQVVQHAADQGVVPGASPATATQLQEQQVQRQQGRRHHAAHAEAGAGPPYTWAPLRDFQTDERHLGHPRPDAQPVPGQAHADPRARFPAVGEPQLRRPARQLLVVHQRPRRATPTASPTCPPSIRCWRIRPSSTRARRGCATCTSRRAWPTRCRIRTWAWPAAPVQQLKARTNPLDAFNDLFGGVDRSGRRRHADAADARRAADRSRLPGLPRAASSNARLSAEDKQMVDQYVNL